ncbi:MAG TPA: PEGA domain-containing protein [Planctomycetota bacterium]|nr:PEGA domain-containing protein [Planctomycetota bacterium]
MKLHHIEYAIWTAAALVILAIVGWGAVLLNRPDRSGTLVVETTPGRASVWVDGNFVGTAPVRVEGLTAGRHVLRAVKFGHVESVRWVDVTSGANAVQCDLATLPDGSMKVTSEPPGAEVFVAGELRGRTPLVVDGLRPDRYPVRLRLVNYLDWTDTVEVETNRTAERSVSLKSRTEAGYLAAIRADSNDVIAYVDLAHYYILRDEWKKAEEAFTNALVVTAREPSTAHYTGRLTQEIQKVWGMQFKYSDLQRGREVVTNAYVNAVEKCPTYQRYYGTAIQYAGDLGMNEKARKVIETGILSFPHSQSWAAQTVPSWNRRGRGDDERVLRLVDARLKKDPNDFVAHFQRMTVMRERGETDEVIKEYTTLIPLTRDKRVRSRLMLELGRMHERKQDYARAAEAYRDAVRDEPLEKDKAPIQYNLVRVLGKLDRHSDALDAWEQAVRFQEDVELACRWRLEWAAAAISAKRLDKADAVLRDVLKLSQDEKTRSRAETLLKNVKETNP